MTDKGRLILMFYRRFWNLTMRSRLIQQIFVLTQRDLKLKYKNTFLGFFWSMLLPLCQTVVFFLVFNFIMSFNMPKYLLYLVSGLFLWQCLSNIIAQSLYLFIGNGNLIKRTQCHRSALVWACGMTELIHLFCTMPVLVLIMIYFDVSPGWSALTLPWVFLNIFLFSMGLGLVFATLQLLFRDLERIIAIVLQLWFYLTPVFYSVDMIPAGYSKLLYFNPFFFIIESWRNVFYEPKIDFNPLIFGGLYAIVFLLVGLGIYKSQEKRFGELI